MFNVTLGMHVFVKQTHRHFYYILNLILLEMIQYMFALLKRTNNINLKKKDINLSCILVVFYVIYTKQTNTAFVYANRIKNPGNFALQAT